jgi:hypothetical protein
MTTMTHDAEFDLDRFLSYLENLRLNRPGSRRSPVADHAAGRHRAEPTNERDTAHQGELPAQDAG